MEIIRAGQVAAFAKDGDSGMPRGVEDEPFTDPEAVTCALFDSVDEARAFCEAAVQRHPSLHFDIFDADGRTRPPLLTIVHPQRAGALETSPREMRRRRLIAWVLIVGGVPPMLFAYFSPPERDTFLIAFLGLNMVLIGGRLLWMNFALRETEHTREKRLRQRER